MTKPNLVNSNITYQTTGRKLALLQELQQQLWREFDLQVDVGRAGVDNTTSVIDKQYVKEKKEEYRGYAGNTTLNLLAHVGTWLVITNTERIDTMVIFYAPWSDSPNQHIKPYARQLDRRQRDCTTLQADVSDKDKVTHFVQQMYQSGFFEEDFLEEWEASADQSWDATKRKSGDQFGIVTCASNHEAKRSGFESTNSLREHPLFLANHYHQYPPPNNPHANMAPFQNTLWHWSIKLRSYSQLAEMPPLWTARR